MKINHVRISNFKEARTVELTPAKVNVFIGPNGSGKTSILQALRYGLTGNSPQDAITGGAKKAIVDLTFPDIGTLTRTLYPGKNEVRLNGKVTTQKSINELFASHTGTSVATAELLTSADALTGLTSGELSAYFLDNNLLNVEVDFQLLASFCKLSPKGIEALRQEFGDAPIRVSDIDRVWNDTKARRRVLKQEIAKMEVLARDTGPDIKESAEEVDKQLRLLLQRQGELQAIQKSYMQVCRQREQIMRDIRNKKSQMGTQIQAPDTALLDRYSAELNRIEKEIQNLKGVVATTYEHGKQLSQILKDLELSTCPISSKLTCTTDKSTIRTELTEAIDKVRVQYKEQRFRIGVLDKERAKLQEARRALEEQIRLFHNQELLQKQIEYLEKSLPEEPQKPSEEELQQISVKVQEFNQKQAQIIRNLTAMEYKDAWERQSRELAVAEEIVRELDPKNGVRQQILEHSLKPLEDYFNAGLAELLPEYRIRLDCSNGFVLKLIDGEQEYDAAKSASAGERSRIWFVLMDLINALSSYRVLIYDNTDGMDAASLLRLLRLLNSEEVQSRYDHIFVSMIDYTEVLQQLNQMRGISVIRTATDSYQEKAA